jgi:hypothetical protein
MPKYKPVAYCGTPGQIRWRMCGRKVAYDTEALALTDFRGRAYRCPHCKKYHRTNVPKN